MKTKKIKNMKIGSYSWDTKTELRTRCKLSLRLLNGYQFFTAGLTPLAVATLLPDGETLDIVVHIDRVSVLIPPNKIGHYVSLENQ